MKKNSIIIFFMFLVLASMNIISCTSDKLVEPTVGEECDNYDATYNGDIKPIIDATCALAGCHVAGGGAPGNYETYEGLAADANDGPNGLRDRVIVLVNDPENGMPPDWDTNPGPNDLTDEQFEVFRCWVNAGYPEN